MSNNLTDRERSLVNKVKDDFDNALANNLKRLDAETRRPRRLQQQRSERVLKYIQGRA